MALFGGMPFPVQFFLAFVIVLGLIGATAWAVRRFGAGALGSAGLRGRHPRLAVLEHTLVEGRRRLYLVRRDNVEHLLLIGGPTDIVVEANILRAAPAQREVGVARPSAAVEALARTIPLPEHAGNGAWPLQPEPAAPAAAPRAPRHEPEQAEIWPSPSPPESPARSQRETLAALADELSVRPPSPRPRPQPATRAAADTRAAPAAAPEVDESSDQNLAEMAQRLEAALRKPAAKAEARPARPPAMPRVASNAETASSAQNATPQSHSPIPAPANSGRGAESRPARPEVKPVSSGKTLYDSLEQEMASLLGRPANKT